jgi:hypothetical protein
MDNRNDLAKARDKFIGELGDEYYAPAARKYIENRYESIFCAGWNQAMEKIKKEMEK